MGPLLVTKALSSGDLILAEIDGELLPKPFSADSVKVYFVRK